MDSAELICRARRDFADVDLYLLPTNLAGTLVVGVWILLAWMRCSRARKQMFLGTHARLISFSHIDQNSAALIKVSPV